MQQHGDAEGARPQPQETDGGPELRGAEGDEVDRVRGIGAATTPPAGPASPPTATGGATTTIPDGSPSSPSASVPRMPGSPAEPHSRHRPGSRIMERMTRS